MQEQLFVIWLKPATISVCTCFLIGFSCFVQATFAQNANGRGKTDTIMVCPWEVANISAKCKIAENIDSTGLKNRTLSVEFTSKGKRNQNILYETLDYPIGMLPLGDSDAILFTLWTSGSAYHIRIFAFRDGDIDCVVDDGSKIFPEFVHGPKMSLYMIYAKSLSLDTRNYMKPDSCIVMELVNGQCKPLGTSSWGKRFQAVERK